MRSRIPLAVLLGAGGALRAQPPDTFDLWLQDRIDAAVDQARIGINGKSLTRQTGSPSATDRSASPSGGMLWPSTSSEERSRSPAGIRRRFLQEPNAAS